MKPAGTQNNEERSGSVKLVLRMSQLCVNGVGQKCFRHNEYLGMVIGPDGGSQS